MNFQPDDLRPLHNVLWNLFLAAVPIVLAFMAARLIRQHAGQGRRLVDARVAGLLVLWAVFLPNTCYLLTEWRHYIVAVATHNYYPEVRYDHLTVVRLLISTTFYIFYSGSGLISFFLAVWPIDRIVRERSIKKADVMKIAIFALCSLGVYLGLIHRYNSWNLVNPHVLRSILKTIADILTRRFVVILMLAFTIVLWLLYLAFDVWMDGFTARLSGRKLP